MARSPTATRSSANSSKPEGSTTCTSRDWRMNRMTNLSSFLVDVLRELIARAKEFNFLLNLFCTFECSPLLNLKIHIFVDHFCINMLILSLNSYLCESEISSSDIMCTHILVNLFWYFIKMH